MVFCKCVIYATFCTFLCIFYAKLVRNCALFIHVPSIFLTRIVYRHLVFGTPGSQMSCTHKIYSEAVINKDLYFL